MSERREVPPPPAGKERRNDQAARGRFDAMRISRRGMLAGASALAAAAFSLCGPAGAVEASLPRRPGPGRPGSRLDALFGNIDPFLEMRNGLTGETVAVRFHDGSRYDRRAVRELNRFMRDFREDRETDMDARLFWSLAAVSQAARLAGFDAPTVFLSGFRTRRTNRSIPGAVRNSLHLDGRAVDFLIPGVPTDKLAAYAHWLQIGGVGHYRGRFVHVDTGPPRRWTSA